jgi:hypothetical protein
MNIFNNDISFLIKLRAKSQILEIVSKKHIIEIAEEISIEDKWYFNKISSSYI